MGDSGSLPDVTVACVMIFTSQNTTLTSVVALDLSDQQIDEFP